MRLVSNYFSSFKFLAQNILIKKGFLRKYSFDKNSNSLSSIVRREPTKMKLDSPHFKSLFTPELEQLIGLFKKYDYELRIAGGAVRDLLTDKIPEDLDFATTATPDQMNNLFSLEGIRVLNKNGEAHGTVTARINDKVNFEVTTLRIDIVTDGRRAQVQFTTDWQLDANRRDLTINSLFLDFEGTIYDYFNGIEDLKKRRVVFVGDPTTRIREDYLRILRYFRFYGRIADHPNNHETSTLDSIKETADGLARISGERIWSELKKILAGNHVGNLIPVMLNTGLAPYIGLPNSPNVENFKTVFERAQHLKPQPITLLAALLNNEKEMMQLHLRQKFSAYERDLGLFVVTHRDDKPHEKALRPYQKLCYESNHQRHHVQEWICEVFKYRGEEDLLKQFQAWEPPKFPINGFTLKEKGIKTGKHYSSILKKLREIWSDNDFSMSDEELLSHLDSVLKELGIK